MLIHGLVVVDLKEVVYEVCKNHLQEMENCEGLIGKAVIGMITVYMVLAVLHAIFSSMLIHGIRRDKTCLMVPHMVMKLIGIIFAIIASAALLVIIMVDGTYVVLFAIILYGLIIFLETYFLLVLRAHYLDIKRSEGSLHKVLPEAPSFDEGGSPFQSKTFYP